MLSDRYIAEFMEKYESLNLEGYNSGGYAYRETNKIFSRAEEEHKGHASAMKDVSTIAESVRVSKDTPNIRRESLFDKFKKSVGMRVTDDAEDATDL